MTQIIPRPRDREGRAAGAAGPDSLLVCAPLRVEARAVRRGLDPGPPGPMGPLGPPATVLRTGFGPARAARQAEQLDPASFGPLMIMGTGAGLDAGLRPGDLVVGTEAGGVACPSAPILAGELRRAGLAARAGRITTVDHLVRRSQRDTLRRRNRNVHADRNENATTLPNIGLSRCQPMPAPGAYSVTSAWLSASAGLSENAAAISRNSRRKSGMAALSRNCRPA